MNSGREREGQLGPGRGQRCLLRLLPVLHVVEQGFQVGPQVSAVDLAERPEVGELGRAIPPLPAGRGTGLGCHHVSGVAGPAVGLVQHPASMFVGFGQHLVVLAPGVMAELTAVLLRIGHVLVRHLLGVRQDPDGLHVGVLRAGTGRVTGVDDAPPQALDLLPQRRLLVQQGHQLVQDLVTERMHGLLVEAATAEPGRGKLIDCT